VFVLHNMKLCLCDECEWWMFLRIGKNVFKIKQVFCKVAVNVNFSLKIYIYIYIYVIVLILANSDV